VPSDRGDGAIEFLMASPSQLDDVLAILDEAARWLQARGVSQWPSRFEPSWAGVARERGLDALRLDCVASNDRFRAYYEAAGFIHRGDVTVAGAPGLRLGEGPVTVVSRYELRLREAP